MFSPWLTEHMGVVTIPRPVRTAGIGRPTGGKSVTGEGFCCPCARGVIVTINVASEPGRSSWTNRTAKHQVQRASYRSHLLSTIWIASKAEMAWPIKFRNKSLLLTFCLDRRSCTTTA